MLRDMVNALSVITDHTLFSAMVLDDNAVTDYDKTSKSEDKKLTNKIITFYMNFYHR